MASQKFYLMLIHLILWFSLKQMEYSTFAVTTIMVYLEKQKRHLPPQQQKKFNKHYEHVKTTPWAKEEDIQGGSLRTEKGTFHVWGVTTASCLYVYLHPTLLRDQTSSSFFFFLKPSTGDGRTQFNLWENKNLF